MWSDYADIEYIVRDSFSAGRVFGNSSWLVMGSVFTMLIGVFVTGIAARHFGPSEFGLLNFAVAFASLLAVISTLGMESTVVKSLVDRDWDEGVVLCTSSVLRLFSGALFVAVAWSLINLLEPSASLIRILVLVMSFSIMLRAFDIVDYWMQAHLKARMSSLIRMSTYVISASLKLMVISAHLGIVAFALVFVADSLIFGIAIVVAYYHSRDGLESRWRIDFHFARHILREGAPFILSGLMISLYNRVDQVMLGAMLSDKSEVGIYSAAVTVAEMWYFVPSAIVISFKPVVFEKKKLDQRSYLEAMQTLYDVVAFVSLLACALVTIFAGLIVAVIYGSQYSDSTQVLVVLVWAGTFSMLGMCRTVWLLSEGLQRFATFYTLAALAVNVAMNLLLIPYFGAIGAAWATLAAQLVNILTLSIFSRTRLSTTMILRSFWPGNMIRGIWQALRR